MQILWMNTLLCRSFNFVCQQKVFFSREQNKQISDYADREQTPAGRMESRGEISQFPLTWTDCAEKLWCQSYSRSPASQLLGQQEFHFISKEGLGWNEAPRNSAGL